MAPLRFQDGGAVSNNSLQDLFSSFQSFEKRFKRGARDFPLSLYFLTSS